MKIIHQHLLIVAALALISFQSCKSNKAVAINPVPDSTIYSFIKAVMMGHENQQFSPKDIIFAHNPPPYGNDTVDISQLAKTFTKNDLSFVKQQYKTFNSFTLNPRYLPGWKIIPDDSVKALLKQNHGDFWGDLKKKYGKTRFYTISMPLFSKDKNIAVIKIENNCGMCGGGGTYVYKKVNNKWTLIDKFDEWYS